MAREREKRRIGKGHRSRLDEQRDVSRLVFNDLFSFVSGDDPLRMGNGPDADLLREDLRQRLGRIVQSYERDQLPSLRNWISFRVRRNVTDGTLREIPDESDPARCYLFAVYELFKWDQARDVRICQYEPCGRFFLKTLEQRVYCCPEHAKAHKTTMRRLQRTASSSKRRRSSRTKIDRTKRR